MRRLPGIAFETVPPTPAETLPRMDIAAFVGFADAGPVDVPVAVEDSARFRDLFGTDPILARDGSRDQTQGGLLGAAVEAFFANGGRRCHVVRVARSPVTRGFALPGLIAIGGNLAEPYRARARCPGAWADHLSAGTRLQATSLASRSEAMADNPAIEHQGGRIERIAIEVAVPPGRITPSDLIEVAFLPGHLVLFAAITELTEIDRGLRLVARSVEDQTRWQWARTTLADPSAGTGMQRSAALTLLPDADGLADYSDWQAAPAAERLVRLRRLAFEIHIWRGGRLQRWLGDLAFCAGHPRFFGNLPSDEALFAATPLRRADGRDAELAALRLEASGGRSRTAASGERRFPLAGPAEQTLDLRWPLYLPDAMELGRAAAASDPPGVAADAPHRNGLAELRADLFFDSRLRHASGEALLRSAAHLQNPVRDWWQRPQGTPPQRLRGLHAVLPLQEATLIAIPDAAQLPWTSEPQPPAVLLDAPLLHPVDAPDARGRLTLSWTEVSGATGYRLERSATPDFHPAEPVYEGPDTGSRASLPADCAGVGFFRVQAARYGERSPWSITRRCEEQRTGFGDCDRLRLPELSLMLVEPSPPADGMRLSWRAETVTAMPGLALRIEHADDALFQTGRTLAETTANDYPLPSRSSQRWYRVRVLGAGLEGPASNSLFVPAASAGPLPRQQPVAGGADDALLLGVHRALLRFCAARGDLLALLCAPRHFGAPELLDHLAALTPDLSAPESGYDAAAPQAAPLTGGEAAALSYGALYHPWIAGLTEASPEIGERREVRWQPPVGAVAGRLARRALDTGAWRSSADQPLAGVLALDPPLGDADRALLTALQLNLLRPDPRGFVAINDETLSRSEDLRPVSVRRLLILLKRLALREGAAYVFEPLTGDFPDRVRHRFQRLLGILHQRGAFQGEEAGDAYRVVVDASVNPPGLLDLGRFSVELRVAPSRPLTFLRVRLVQQVGREPTAGEL
jgi:hypothetical protein